MNLDAKKLLQIAIASSTVFTSACSGSGSDGMPVAPVSTLPPSTPPPSPPPPPPSRGSTADMPAPFVSVIAPTCSASCSIACKDLTVNESVCASEPMTPMVAIEASRTECTAPCGVHFVAEELEGFSVDRPWHELSFIWRYGDHGSEFRSLSDDFSFSRDANRSQGFVGGHVYEHPGTYEVTITASAIEGTWSQATETIIVRDPDDVFAGDLTRCVSTNADFFDCPDGAGQFENILDAFADIGDANGKTTKARVLLKAGDTFSIGADQINLSNADDIVVTRFGDGADPIIEKSTTERNVFFANFGSNISFSYIDVRGNYDAASGLGDTFAARGFAGRENNHITLYRTAWSGLDSGIKLNPENGIVVVADTVITNWYDYGIWADFAGGFSLIGSTIRQNPDTVSGPGAKDKVNTPRWADHGPLRFRSSNLVLLSQNDLESLNGWSSDGRAHQPATRLGSGGQMSAVFVENISRSTGFGAGPTNRDTAADGGDWIAERNIVFGTENTTSFFISAYNGVTLRNNLGIMPDVENAFTDFSNMVSIGGNDNLTFENGQRPVWIYNNTFIQLQSDENNSRGQALFAFDNVYGEPQSFIIQNNVTHVPSATNASSFENYWPLDAEDYYRPVNESPALWPSMIAPAPLFDTLDGFRRSDNPSDGALELARE